MCLLLFFFNKIDGKLLFEERSVDNVPNPVFYCASITLLLQLVYAIGIGSVGFNVDVNGNPTGTLPMTLSYAARMAIHSNEYGDEVHVDYIDLSASSSALGASSATRASRSPGR